MQEKIHHSEILHALHKVPSIGQEKILRLLKYFPSPEKVWNAPDAELLRAGLSENDVTAIDLFQKNLKQRKLTPEALWEKYKNQGIGIISITDKEYPSKILQEKNAPAILYYRGDIAITQKPCVAVVGSRKFTTYGKQSASRLSYDLATYGLHIVSGLALGIDGIAHHASLEAARDATPNAYGKAIAVLGGGIDDQTIAPRAHTKLAHDIITSGGLLLSTFAPGVTPNKGTFPARNATMVMLSDAVLIIEAAKSSGTLITAQMAHKTNKKIFAVPGSIFTPSSVGSNHLIASNRATLAQSANDIAQALGVSNSKKKSATTYTPETSQEKAIYETLLKHPNGVLIDKIVRETTLEGAVVSSTLVMMEIQGVTIHLGGGQYALHQ